MDYSYIFLFVSFVLTIAVIYLTILMVRKWYITFSPKEMAFFGLIMFSAGWVVASYLLGSVLQILEGSTLIFIFFGYFVYKWNKRRVHHKEKQEAGIV